MVRRVRIRTYGECAESRLTVPAQVSRVHTQQESKQPGRRRRRRGSKVSGELEEENYSATPVCGSLLSPILVRACLCPSSRFCCDETTWEIGTQDVFSDGNWYGNEERDRERHGRGVILCTLIAPEPFVRRQFFFHVCARSRTLCSWGSIVSLSLSFLSRSLSLFREAKREFVTYFYNVPHSRVVRASLVAPYSGFSARNLHFSRCIADFTNVSSRH